MTKTLRAATLAVMCAVAGCGEDGPGEPLFERLPGERTGIDFVNEVVDSPPLNIMNYVNFYNGGGVAAGDVDGDGLVDLYFTANRGPDRLYRNLGDYRFEDVTEAAGLGREAGWTTGVTMADVDGDGDLDIHISGVTLASEGGSNILYLNDGAGVFEDGTDALGLRTEGYGTQSVFFDYDLDGDLDVYMLRHSTHTDRGVSGAPQRTRHPRAGDRLMRNDDGRFVEVTEEAGIYNGVDGYGLGVVVSDLDLNGCPDIYVANDFQENDFLYFNECDGTFTESIERSVGHTSRSSMGVDAADLDNDGRPDLFVLDMLPEDEAILKSSANWDAYDLLDLRLQVGYHAQFAHNTLQLNRGARRFSEIAFLSGVEATDWSWAPLLADFDLDGRKDLFVTNGIYRRPNDLDYLTHVRTDAVQLELMRGYTEENLALVDLMPNVPAPNYLFRNEGGLAFTDVADRWGVADPGFSTGAVYADLTGTGVLDLVVNNVNGPATVYRNRARELTANHSLAIELVGTGGNRDGIGARVIVHAGGATQVAEQTTTRGFHSSVAPGLHFGLGAAAVVDSVVVIWPGGSYQVARALPADTVFAFDRRDAAGMWTESFPGDAGPLFHDLTAELGVTATHEENRYFDFTREPLMPGRVSLEGPALATGDVDGDGLDDLFLGGAKHRAGRLLLQRPDGGFREVTPPAFAADSLAEDVDAALFDADGDGDLDLYVVSAGNEFWGEVEPLRDRLYRNDGTGRLERDRSAVPDVFENGGTVAPADFDGDGDIDLFVGSRVVAREFGRTPTSHLLENDGTGRFTVVAEDRAGSLATAGMVTGAVWSDVDADGALELVVTTDWGPVRLFRREGGRFEEGREIASGGWWRSVAVADLDGDGDEDLVLGNRGGNGYLRASPREPARMYVHDFGRDGSLEQIVTSYREGESRALATRDELLRHFPEMAERYPTYASFGAATLDELFPSAELRQATLLEVTAPGSVVASNDGQGRFSLEPLPLAAQLAPIHAMMIDDFDGDGRLDLLAGGNFHGAQPSLGRQDGSYGLFLRGDGTGGFEAVGLEESGVVIDGQVRALGLMRASDGGRLVAVARNSAPLVILGVRR